MEKACSRLVGVVDQDGDLYAVGDVQLVEQAGHVRFDCGFAHEQGGGDLGVGRAGLDRGGNLTFAVGQRGESLGGVPAAFSCRADCRSETAACG